MKYKDSCHEYQKYCIDYIIEHPIAALLLDCGLGKTSITLAAIHELMKNRCEIKKVLIVAPLRVALVSWPDELSKWDEFSDFTYSVINGSPKARMKAASLDTDLHIVNRENLAWLIQNTEFNYDMVILDELSSFKNWQSKRFKAFMMVRPKVKRVVGLTGTPSSNSLMDLFAEYKCLDMGERLGRFISQYRLDFFVPDQYNGPVVYSYKLRPHADEWIYSRISDITISMKSVDHLNMPDLISNRYVVRMSDKELQEYKEFKSDMFRDCGDEDSITAANAASLTGKLCQMANGCVYSDDRAEVHIHDAKLDGLEDLVEAANGRPVLVAYWYKHDLKRIQERLDKMKVNYKVISSVESMREWNQGKIQVGLMHPASLGHGTNLQAGSNTLIWFGLTWSLELYQQTIARLWRQGQKASTVVVHHIITEETIDEKILDALEHKNVTQAALIDAVKAQIGGSDVKS